ncbi:PASTA domain-containing protein [Bifidobacterium imperatoris]|uniref:non-specific serine/threonine protein kinase n=1 Tax=Bifidobacterium imperatoris TaxID=2020965 RepID=A0A2N5IVG6_9BIFI|nr:Stk1 family PASTA domain-containing Ser/Thr kinase [Bifidobacterium imperatoris]PLS25927.1 serine/threonine protein kinase [Bifidobacterium imperatoris]QSY57604.1 PASTA domain-containing protein [Bifidobacterium imperatoris]
MSENEPAQMIEGRYRIVRNIAEGGMATVYEAVDERLGRTVAIKVMHTQLAQGPHRAQFVERFRREANSAAAIANPHIVQVYDTGEFNGLDFLVMEYVHGINLRHEMNVQGTFSVRETLRIIAETLDGLASAHRIGVVHRDIKPENILLNDRGHVQITDFGLAKAASQATLSSTGMLLGTAAYLAPEMIENNLATPQGDLYSVGIMAWEMLAGKVPFDSDNPVTLVFKHVHEDVPSIATVCSGIDPTVAAFISHLTARAVEARPKDGTEAASELRQLAAKLPLEAWQYRFHAETAGSNRNDATAPALVGAIGKSAEHLTAMQSAPLAPPVPPASATINQPGAAGNISASAPIAPTTALDSTAASSSNANGIGQTRVMRQNSASDDGETQVLPQMAGEPTQALHSSGTIHAVGESTSEVPSPDHPTKKSHRKIALIIAAIVAIVLVCVGGGFGWWWYVGPGSYWSVPQPEDVSCTTDDTQCSLSGADWSTYESLLKTAGIPYTSSEQFSDTVDKGKIISATIDKTEAFVHSHVGKRSDQQIEIVVSKGAHMVTVPDDILDPTSANGKDPLNALKNAGFSNITHDESGDQYSMDVPEGAALTISPDPGTTVKHDAEVTITLSKGPMPVSMPDIVGKTKDEMLSTFSDLKLTANITEEFDDKIASGTVISSSQKAGTQLKWGDSVDVVISKGPETTVLPNVVGMTYDDAAKQLEKLGFTVKKSAPLGDLTHEVRIQSPKAGETVRLRDENGTPTVITLTVV